MEIVNNIKDESYIQWIEKFVTDVINKAGLSCNKVTIDDIEFNKRIYLTIDREEYDIRTWNFRPFEFDVIDGNEIPCAEEVDYTLFKMVMDDDNNGHGEEISEGCIEIKWKNE